jgi:PAS domain S-box-containing protein
MKKNSRDLRILIVEDDFLVRASIRSMVERSGHTVVGEAANGREAVAMTESSRPDVILMDIQMPEMDGLEATRLIQERCPTAVVVVTAFQTPELVERASAAGAGAYLTKPVNAREIESAISISLARFDDMMALRRLNEALQAEMAERVRAESQRAATLEALRKSEGLHREAQRVAHIGHWEMVPEIGTPTWSDEIFDIFGLDPERGEPSFVAHQNYMPPDDWDLLNDSVQKASTDGTPFDIEFRLLRPDQEIRWMRAVGTVRKDENGKVTRLFGTAQDITDLKRAEEALHESLEETARNQRLLLALSQAAQAVQRARTPKEIYRTVGEEVTRLGLSATVLTLSLDRTHLTVSYMSLEPALLRVVERLTHLSARDYRFPLVADGFFQRIVTDGEATFTRELVEPAAQAMPGPLRPLAGRLADLLGWKQGIVVPLVGNGEMLGLLAVTGSDLSESDVPAITAFANQAAIALENARLFDQVRAGQQRLQALSRQLVEVQEAERRHLARELHDQVGQTLTGLKLVLQMSQQQRDERERQAKLEAAQALIDDLAARVEDLSLDLRPSMLDDLGLLPTLLWHIERYTTQTGVEVRLKHAGVEGRRFTPEVETAAYRLVQEALTNVARHAGASEVLVRLWAHPDLVGVQIQDAGRGFDAEAVLASGQSSGLASMRERAALLHGKLSIESAPGAGTRLTAELPLGI